MVAKDGQQTGPFNMDQLKEMAGSGELSADSLVWKQGMANWEKAGSVGDLSGLFGAAAATAPPDPEPAADAGAGASQAQPEPAQQPAAQPAAAAPSGAQQQLPNATGALVLGILSLVFAFCYAIPGLIMGIIGMILGKKAIEIYEANPQMYNESHYNNAKAGRICSIIGVILASVLVVVFILYFVFIFSVVGAAAGSSW